MESRIHILHILAGGLYEFSESHHWQLSCGVHQLSCHNVHSVKGPSLCCFDIPGQRTQCKLYGVDLMAALNCLLPLPLLSWTACIPQPLDCALLRAFLLLLGVVWCSVNAGTVAGNEGSPRVTSQH